MELIRGLIKVLKENVLARLWFGLGILTFLLTPIFVYIKDFERVSEVDTFQAAKFDRETISEIYQIGSGRDKYRKFKIDGDDMHSYPLRVTSYGTDTLITRKSLIWKEANSKYFKIIDGGQQMEFELSDQRTNMKIEMTVFMTMIFGWTILMTFLSTVKFGQGNDAQHGV